MTTRRGENKKKKNSEHKKNEGQGKGKWEIVWKRRRRSGRAGDRRKLLPDTLFFSTIQEQDEKNHKYNLQQYKNKMKKNHKHNFQQNKNKKKNNTNTNTRTNEDKSQVQFAAKQEQNEE